MLEDFEGKVAVVTGAASGIGKALATRFVEEGMKVVLADVERDALREVTRESLSFPIRLRPAPDERRSSCEVDRQPSPRP